MAESDDFFFGSRLGGYVKGFSMPISPYVPSGRHMHGDGVFEDVAT